MSRATKLPLGIKVIIGFFLLSTVLWTIGQGGAVVAYDTVVQWGLQDPREGTDPVFVETNRAIGLADMLVHIPLFLPAIIGLWQRRFYGAVFSWLVLGTTIYWPVVAWTMKYFFAQAAVEHIPFDAATNGILAFIVLFAIWASWYLFKNRRMFE